MSESRLDYWFRESAEFERYVGSLFEATATLNLYRVGGGGHVHSIWIHSDANHADDGFSLGVDGAYLGGLETGMSYRLSRESQQRVRQMWRDAIHAEQEDDYQDYLDTGMAAVRGVL